MPLICYDNLQGVALVDALEQFTQHGLDFTSLETFVDSIDDAFRKFFNHLSAHAEDAYVKWDGEKYHTDENVAAEAMWINVDHYFSNGATLDSVGMVERIAVEYVVLSELDWEDIATYLGLLYPEKEAA